MDRFMTSNIEKRSIYEIFRACRLCGAGGGYKMPIIQNIINIDGSDVELRQKILECVQIEVNQNDKMPPLICELCLDKVNDFYEFLEMCRQTNKRTRLRLGLPPQAMPKGAPDAGDCILGVTEPVYISDDSNEPLSKNQAKGLKKTPTIKKEPETKPKAESNKSFISAREIRSLNITEPIIIGRTHRRPSPVRVTRTSRSALETSTPSRSRNPERKPPAPFSTKANPKSAVKRDVAFEQSSPMTARSVKRLHEKESPKAAVSIKRVKIEVNSPQPPPKHASKPMPRPKQTTKAAPPTKQTTKAPPPSRQNTKATPPTKQSSKPPAPKQSPSPQSRRVSSNTCSICCKRFHTDLSLRNHLTGFHNQFRTNMRLKMRSNLSDVHKSVASRVDEEREVQCATCWKHFANEQLRTHHKCGGVHSRPGGTCDKCNRIYITWKNFSRHQAICVAKEKDVIVDPEVRARLRTVQVRVAKCDSLLSRGPHERYDVSDVAPTFGLDTSCAYPYMSSSRNIRIKNEPSFNELDGMCHLKDEFDFSNDYVHWDSDNSNDSQDGEPDMALNTFVKRKRVESLSALTLKMIFSQSFLGKVPKKRRKIKRESNVFDATLNTTFDNNMRRDIDNIIDNLDQGDDDTNANGELSVDNVNNNIDTNNDDSLDTFLQNNEKRVVNTTNVALNFDLLFKHNVEKPEMEVNENVNNNSNNKVQNNEQNVNSYSVEPIVTSISQVDAAIVNDKTKNIALNSHEDLSKNDSKEHEKRMDIDANISKENETNNVLHDINIEESTQIIKIKENNDQKEDFIKNYDGDEQNDLKEHTDEIARKDLNMEKESIKDDINADLNVQSKQSENADINSNNDENLIENSNRELNTFSTETDDKSEIYYNNDNSINTNDSQDGNSCSLIINNAEMERITEFVDDKSDSDNKNSVEILQKTQDNSSDVNNDSAENSDISNAKTEVIDLSENSNSNRLNIDNLEDISDTEMDDKTLMDEIDAQIGESDDKTGENNECSKNNDNSEVKDGEKNELTGEFNAINYKNCENIVNAPSIVNNSERITFEDLFPNKESDLKSMDLDNISDDDFNFDA